MLTRTQVIIAAKLAREFGHTWGCILNEDGDLVEDAPEELSQESIEKWVHATGDPGPCGWGIDSPSTIGPDRMIIYHKTGTGRTSWFVDEDGRVDIYISRPNDTEDGLRVLSAIYYPTSDSIEVFIIEEEDYALRHCYALEKAIQALKGKEYSLPLSVYENAK